MQLAHDTIAGLVASYGYTVLFIVVAVESFGIPLPGETALVTAAAVAALGRLNIALVITTAAAAAILGDNVGYWIGREGGPAFVRSYGRYVGLSEVKLARVRSFFERHGGKTIFIARFIALLRSWAAMLAGASRMSYSSFTLYNALGGVVWATTFGLLGDAFGRNVPLLQRYGAQASLAATLLLALVILFLLARRWFWPRREALASRVSKLWVRVANDPRFAGFRQRHAKLWTIVAARFARGEYLGLHLTIGLIVSVAALWLFAGVTEDVIHHDPLTALDLDILTWFRAHSTPALDRVGVLVSLVGSPVAMAVVAVIVAIVLAVRHRWILLGGWVGVFAGGGVLDWGLKRVIQRPRPTGASAFLHGESFSFPSGHAMGSLFGYGMLAYLLARFWAKSWRQRLTIIVIGAVLVVSIGLSRLYLGVHYFSDVVAGYAAGLVWLATCVSGVEITLGHRGHHPWDVGLERRAQPRPASIAAPGEITSAGMITRHNELADLGWHGVEAAMVADGVTFVLKGMLGRGRPVASGDTNPHDFHFAGGFGKESRQSFPSGHTTTAFAVAAAVTSEARRHWPTEWWSTWLVAPAMYGGATMVGAARMYHNMHWASDVAMGAAIGTFTGRIVQFNHAHPHNLIDRTILRTAVVPSTDVGFSLVWSAPIP